MRAVLDTNVLLSALLSPGGAPHRAFAAWRAGRFELATCPRQLDEVRRASRYPRFRTALQPHRVGAVVNALRADALPDPPDRPRAEVVHDPDDAWLLALAEASGADWLVTGDRRSGLLALRSVGRARIAGAAEFCEALGL